jgi:hypothetical protein
MSNSYDVCKTVWIGPYINQTSWNSCCFRPSIQSLYIPWDHKGSSVHAILHCFCGQYMQSPLTWQSAQKQFANGTSLPYERYPLNNRDHYCSKPISGAFAARAVYESTSLKRPYCSASMVHGGIVTVKLKCFTHKLAGFHKRFLRTLRAIEWMQNLFSAIYLRQPLTTGRATPKLTPPWHWAHDTVNLHHDRLSTTHTHNTHPPFTQKAF